MKITKEVKTAILVIASILLFIWGYSFLKGQNILNNHKKLYVDYDNVEGLVQSAPVTISGKIIGKVASIHLKNDGKLLVELQINEDEFPISKTSVAEIYEPGVISGKQIAIIPNYKDKNLVEDGDYLISGVKQGVTDVIGEKLKPLQVKLDDALNNINQLIVNLNNTLDVTTQNNIKKSVNSLNTTILTFNKVATDVDLLLLQNKDKFASTMNNLDKTTANFSKITEELKQVQLSNSINKLEATLTNVNKIMTDLESGKGTMGKLLKDETMYNSFTKTSKELELLLKDLRLHPTRYINVSLFGKKEKPYIPQAE